MRAAFWSRPLAIAVTSAAAAALWPMASVAPAATTATVTIRGHEQLLRLYGPAGGDPIVVSSGDGGWIRLGPHVAEALAARGFSVVGFDVKAYLASFTSPTTALGRETAAADYRLLAEFAGRGGAKKPILVGVSEGAGLSVLAAAADPHTRSAIRGVVALGLPDRNELGWRWKDALIYVTHGVPNEPTFSAAAILPELSPLPLAAIYSTHDEFVSSDDAGRLFERARAPSKLWMVQARDHRFTGNIDGFDRCLVEAIEWVQTNRAS